MNIFHLHKDPVICAEMHIDKHVVKMPIEYAQLMSTAHRVLDGELYLGKTINNRNIKRWRLSDERENVLYKASHINHPSAIWVRESVENYLQMYKLYKATLAEYTTRYGKVHGSTKPAELLKTPPLNIPFKKGTPMPQCMPDDCKVAGNPILAYRKYYIMEKHNIATWKYREKPKWYRTTT